MITRPLIALLVLAAAAEARAQQLPPCPPTDAFIVDQAHLLNDSERSAIQEHCVRSWREQHVAIVVLTVPSMAACGGAGATIETFAARVFESWGGKRSNWTEGVLVIVSAGDRKSRIECGRGWNGRLSATANSIMQGTMVPSFKRNAYGAGIVAGVAALTDAVGGGAYTPAHSAPDYHSTPSHGFSRLSLVVVGLVIAVFIGISRLRLGGSRWHGSRWNRGHHGSMWGAGFGSRSLFTGSTGTGFRSGGGRGFSGGGGASGSW